MSNNDLAHIGGLLIGFFCSMWLASYLGAVLPLAWWALPLALTCCALCVAVVSPLAAKLLGWRSEL